MSSRFIIEKLSLPRFGVPPYNTYRGWERSISLDVGYRTVTDIERSVQRNN